MNIKNTWSCRYLWHCVHYSCLNKPVNLPRGISAIVLYYPRIQPNQKLWTLPCVVLQEPFMLGKNILKSYLPQVDWLRNSPAPLSGVWDEGQRRSKNIRVSGSGQKSTKLYRFDQDHFAISAIYLPSVCQPSKLWCIYKICFWFICLCLSKIKIMGNHIFSFCFSNVYHIMTDFWFRS